jgi:predicted kinase
MITVLMGAPAAGKTTWLRKNKGDEHIYSTELVRVDRDMDVDYFMNMIRSTAIRAAESGKSVIADGTHTITTHRSFWLRLSRRLDVPTRLIIFDTPLSLLLAGNSRREHPCNVQVLKRHHVRMQMAKRIVTHEPWGSIETLVRGV